MARPLLSHIDLRVRDRSRSTAFYDALLGALGFARRDSTEWAAYYDPSILAPQPADFEWFGLTEDTSAMPNSNRIAFMATANDEVDRIAHIVRGYGMRCEGPNYDEGPGYYAVFFEDPDGHPLEVCCRTQ